MPAQLAALPETVTDFQLKMNGIGTGMLKLLLLETRSTVLAAFIYLLLPVTIFVTAVTLQESSPKVMAPGFSVEPTISGIHRR